MPGWEGKSKGTTFGYRVFVSILKRFGIFPAYFMLRFVAFYYFLFSYKSSKHIFRFYNNKHGFNIWRSICFLYRNYYLFGQSIIDKVVLMSGIPNKFTFNFEGEDHLRKMVMDGEGGLLLSAHIGNWEAAGHLLKRLDARINIVIFDGEHEQIKKYMEKVTGERNVKLIVIKNDLSHVYELMDAFKNKEIVCMHADRFIEGNKVMERVFMGEPAKFPVGPFMMATKFKVPVSFVFAMKENDLHYHFFATDAKRYVSSNKLEDTRAMLDDFVAEMEAKVKQYPGQWYNYYNFWN